MYTMNVYTHKKLKKNNEKIKLKKISYFILFKNNER